MPRSTEPELLIARRIWASVGEPWDFSSHAGENRLEGQILDVSGPHEPKGWILCDVSLFRNSGVEVSRVAATRRYAGGGSIVEELLAQGSVGVNLLYFADGTLLTPSRVQEVLANGSGAEFLVGSLHLL